MHNLIVHYHIFKNAGTSLDAVLIESLGQSWISWDPGEAADDVFGPRDLMRFLNSRPQARAISSHQLRPPFPAPDQITVFPLVCLRHPILRCASIYKYDRSLDGRAERQRTARESSFADYVRWNLRQTSDRVFRNFQTIYLSGEQLRYQTPGFAAATGSSFERAIRLIDDLPVFGIVERFDESTLRFERRLRHAFPEISWKTLRENVSGPWLTDLSEIRTSLGSELYDQLESENTYDLSLYEHAIRIFERRGTRVFSFGR